MHIYALYMKEGGKEGKRGLLPEKGRGFFLRKAVLKNSAQAMAIHAIYVPLQFHTSSFEDLNKI